jgi:hypothetical protein
MIGMRKMIGIPEALNILAPGANWVVRDNSYEGIEWQSEDIDLPSKGEVEEKISYLESIEAITVIREIRDWYLQQCDWTQAQDVRSIKGEDWCRQWDEYRQKLRDLPSDTIDPYFDEFDRIQNVVFPDKPNS